jgi:hypothetical protein
MKVIVNVTNAELRGVLFPRYEAVLGNLIGEGYHGEVGEIHVILSDHADVSVIGLADAARAADISRDILEMAQQMTRPDLRDGYFD